MSDTPKIRPAMTAEEWSRARAHGLEAEEYPTVRFVLRDGCLDIETPADFEASPRDRHALAALALYGQPFGFTRGDVTLLHNVAHGLDVNGEPTHGILEVLMALTDQEEDETRSALLDLAARIEALLPPEE
jgi:hypothetical protein